MSNYLITGASGYIGGYLIKYICEEAPEAQVTAQVRNKSRGRYNFPDNVQVLVVDLLDEQAMDILDLSPDYIIHCAAITKSSEMINRPCEVIESVVNTTQSVMKLASRCNVKSVVYLSSMEVYGQLDSSEEYRVSEEKMGRIDLLQTRNCYPLGKRMAENICISYCKEYGVPVKIVRLAQTFGKGILSTDTRVFAQFARAAKEGQNLVLHTDGKSVGNYCGIDDTVSAIMTVLQHGIDGEAYNVVNESNTMTIAEMADLVSEKCTNGKSRVIYDIPDNNIYGYAASTRLYLSGEKMRQLGWKPKQSLEQMYNDILENI